MTTDVLYIVGALLSLGIIIEMVRRRVLREKYAVLWLVIGTAILVIGVFPATLTSVSSWLGVEVPANLLFFVASIVLLLISVQQSSELGRLEERTRTLAEECADLRLRLERLSAERSDEAAHDEDRSP